MRLIVLCMAFLTIINVAVCATASNEPDRMLDASKINRFGDIALRLTNYGIIGGDNEDIPSLEWPRGSGISYLYKGALWFGGKVHRTNENGEILFWGHWPPEDEDDYITEDDPNWNASLPYVVDTLTSVGTDGDLDLVELLPSYNPLEESYLDELFEEYNKFDVLRIFYLNIYGQDDDADGLIDEDSPGRAFVYPDPDGVYCFSLPCDDDGDGRTDEDGGYPGLETGVGYCYDISPFGPVVDRDWGSNMVSSIHFPLGISIEQRTYFWNNLSLANVMILHFKITNVGENTIYDYALSYYLDADIKPFDMGSEGNDDDVSTYLCSEDYEIAYSFDADSDDGETPGLLAVSILGETNCDRACWVWALGDGPDDSDPLDLIHFGRCSANEKYWLQTCLNPDIEKFTSIRDYPLAQIDNPCDTRFLSTVCGDQQGFDNPTENSFNLEPGETRDFFVAIFLSDSEGGLIDINDDLEAFYASDFDLSMFDGEPWMPGIVHTSGMPDGQSIYVDCYVGTTPDDLTMCYRQASETEWFELDLDPEIDDFIIENLAGETDYNIKVVATYEDLSLESAIVTRNTYDYYNTDQNTSKFQTKEMLAYPNPFNPTTTIAFSIPTDSRVTLDVFNIRGQKVRTLLDERMERGEHSVQWTGDDDNGKPCSSGVYLYRMKAGDTTKTSRMLLMK